VDYSSAEKQTGESVPVDVADAGQCVSESRVVTAELHTLVLLHRATVDHLRTRRRRDALQTQSAHRIHGLANISTHPIHTVL